MFRPDLPCSLTGHYTVSTFLKQPKVNLILLFRASPGEGLSKSIQKVHGLKGKVVPATTKAITMHCVRPPDKIDQ